MAWAYRYLPHRDLFIFHATGVLTEEVLLENISRAFADPHFRPAMRVFNDYSAVDEFKVSVETLATVAAIPAVRGIRGRHAFLMFAPIGSGSFRAYVESLGSEYLKVFRDRQEAYDWLNEGVPAEKRISGGPWADVAAIGRR
jgi:hypothetical protein